MEFIMRRSPRYVIDQAGHGGDSPADGPGYRFARMIRFHVFGSILMGAQTPVAKLTNPPWYEMVPCRNNRPSRASACWARVWFTNGSCLSKASAALQLGWPSSSSSGSRM
jgi:hypothetical protein